MKEPTKQEIKEFWEWCGFKESKTKGVWWYPAGGATRDGLLPTDLNNLFKWAVPKLDSMGLACALTFRDSEYVGEIIYNDITEATRIMIIDKDPALALFWAIYKLIKGSNGGD